MPSKIYLKHQILGFRNHQTDSGQVCLTLLIFSSVVFLIFLIKIGNYSHQICLADCLQIV